jgi:hypothetical protein
MRIEEMEERRAKGQCFKCGGKYHPTLHKCPEATLRIIILGDGESINEDGEIVVLEANDAEDGEEPEAECKLIGVLGSMGEYRTMKIGGKIGSVDIVVLIDSGASHNFISPKLATALGLTVKPEVGRRIKLGDGHKIMSKGVCEGLSLWLGGLKVVVDALVLDLGGLDVVLGVSWLCTLGKMLMDWQTLTMQFWQKGQSVTLQGQGQNKEKHGYLNSFLENRLNDREWWFKSLHQQTDDEVSVHEELKPLLKKFAEVFQDTIKLPPMRSKAHQIKLIPNHGAVNVRPYRYPHHQKEEIEKQIDDLLKAGVIRQSMSAFSSPVILVKKKDKSWRMCVD